MTEQRKGGLGRGLADLGLPATDLDVGQRHGGHAHHDHEELAEGGGGHARAAGCSLDLALAEATQRVLEECERELDRADARGR